MAAPWTRESLYREVRKVFLSRRTEFAVSSLSHTNAQATVEYRGRSSVSIKGDPLWGGLIQQIVHESLHVIVDGSLSRFSDALAENMVLALEESVYDYIVTSRARRLWWKKALADKAAASE